MANVCDFQKENRTLGYELKNLWKIYSLAYGFLLFVISISEQPFRLKWCHCTFTSQCPFGRLPRVTFVAALPPPPAPSCPSHPPPTFAGPFRQSPNGSKPFHRAQRVSFSRAQRPPTCSRNGFARIKSIMDGAVYINLRSINSYFYPLLALSLTRWV